MQGKVLKDDSPKGTLSPKRLELGTRKHEATAIVMDSSSDSKGSGSSGATIAGAQTIGLGPWAEMPTLTWKGRAPGASLPPREPCSSQRRAPALPPFGRRLALTGPSRGP